MQLDVETVHTVGVYGSLGVTSGALVYVAYIFGGIKKGFHMLEKRFDRLEDKVDHYHGGCD